MKFRGNPRDISWVLGGLKDVSGDPIYFSFAERSRGNAVHSGADRPLVN